MAYAEKRGKGKKPWRARWHTPEGRLDGLSGFPTKRAALDYGESMETDVRRGTYVDPGLGKITWDDYYAEWIAAQDLAPRTVERYDGYHRNHISPRFGHLGLRSIEALAVDVFEKELKPRLADATVLGIMSLLRASMADAVYDRRIPFSPVRPSRRNRGRREETDARKGIAVELEAVEAIRARLPADEALMVLVCVFTGMRWGEVIGIRRKYLMLVPPDGDTPASGYYVIDKDDGAVHEDKKGNRYLGSPKRGRGRTVELPPFLVALLLAYLEQLAAGREFLFVDGANGWWRRSNFGRRLWRPACDGWAARAAVRGHQARAAALPIVPGLRFHDLRHTHETWLSEDHVAKVARDERLGHRTPGMEGTYNHATAAMRAEILDVLQRRWERVHAAVPVKG
jgi:integrase